MTTSATAVRALRSLAGQSLDGVALRAAVVEPLRRLTGAGPVFIASADPVSWLLTAGLPVDVPGAAARALMAREYTTEDVVTFRGLAAATNPVASLYDRAGSPSESPRWRDVLEPLGWGDELRAAARDRSGTWGFVCLHRERGEAPFGAAERAALSEVLPALAAAFRQALIAPGGGAAAASAPGVVLLDHDDNVVGVTGAARDWLDELGVDDELPMTVRALSSSLRATGEAAPMQVRTRAGRWATLHAAFMHGTGGVAVVIEAAHPREVLPLLSAALGLTAREAEVAAGVLRGESTRLIARRLRMAEGTANVHLRAVYNKAGVHSRGELVARTLGS